MIWLLQLLMLASVATENGPPPLSVPASVSGQLTADCPPVRTAYLDSHDLPTVRGVRHALSLPDREVIIELRSHRFDAYLVVRNGSGQVIAEDDDSLVGTHARLRLSAAQSSLARSLEVCALHGDTGSYELTIRDAAATAEGGNEQAVEPVAAVLDPGAALLDDVAAGRRSIARESGATSAEMARYLERITLPLGIVGAHDVIRQLLEEALRIRRQIHGNHDVHTGKAASLLGEHFMGRGDYVEALPLLEEALFVWRNRLGDQHGETLKAMGNLAKCMQNTGDLRGALELHEQLVTLVEEIHGRGAIETASSIHNLAHAHGAMGDIEHARSAFARAVAIRREHYGDGHPATASSRTGLAGAHFRLGQWGEAERLLLLATEALEVADQAWARHHAASLHLLGTLRTQQGRLIEARRSVERSLDIRSHLLGETHQETAESLAAMAMLCTREGRTEESERYLDRALNVYCALYGEKSAREGTCLDEFARICVAQGMHEEAREHLERALAALRHSLGVTHPATVRATRGLATVFVRQHRSDDARRELESIVLALDKDTEPSRVELVLALNELAALLVDLGEAEAAMARLSEASMICETLGEQHLARQRTNETLAMTLARQGYFEHAREVFEETLDIAARTQDLDYPKIGRLRVYYASALQELGSHAEAREQFTQAIEILSPILGDDHEMIAASWAGLSEIALALGELDSAIDHAYRSLACRRDLLEREMAALPESDRFLSSARHRLRLDRLLSIADNHHERMDIDRIYSEVIAWKGIVSRGVFQDRSWLQQQADPALLDDQTQLRTVLTALTAPILSGENTATLDELTARRIELERSIAQRSRRGVRRHPATVRVADVQSRLGKNEAIVDFITYDRDEGPRQVAAFILRPRQRTTFVKLGNADTIARTVRFYIEAIRADQRRILARTAQVVHATVWEPVREALAGCRRVIVCPDGAIATLPFETILQPGGGFLIEELEFVYLQNVAELTREIDAAVPGDGILLVGGLDYDGADSGEGATPPAERGDGYSSPVTRSPYRGAAVDRSAIGERFEPLPFATDEIESLARLHERSGNPGPLTVLTRTSATEERVTHALPNQRYVHFATHGAFSGDESRSKFDAAIARVKGDSAFQITRARPDLSELLPGLQSFVALSGANLDHPARQDDGLLTAEEVSWLDLSGCELVTLSACETALGTAKEGEHLIGLRRALRLAGAETTVTSLWRVDDAATSELMTLFYEKLWVEKQGKLDALRGAQLDILSRNRRERGDPSPRSWGAFVLEGNWR